MTDRQAIAWAIIALLLAAGLAALLMLQRQREERRRIMRGHRPRARRKR